MAEVLEAKKNRRRELARLSFEQKIQIVVKLQQVSAEICSKTGRPAPMPWGSRDWK